MVERPGGDAPGLVVLGPDHHVVVGRLDQLIDAGAQGPGNRGQLIEADPAVTGLDPAQGGWAQVALGGQIIQGPAQRQPEPPDPGPDQPVEFPVLRHTQESMSPAQYGPTVADMGHPHGHDHAARHHPPRSPRTRSRPRARRTARSRRRSPDRTARPGRRGPGRVPGPGHRLDRRHRRAAGDPRRRPGRRDRDRYVRPAAPVPRGPGDRGRPGPGPADPAAPPGLRTGPGRPGRRRAGRPGPALARARPGRPGLDLDGPAPRGRPRPGPDPDPRPAPPGRRPGRGRDQRAGVLPPLPARRGRVGPGGPAAPPPGSAWANRCRN